MAQSQQEGGNDLTITPCDDKSFDEIRSPQLKEKATEYGDLLKTERDVETAYSVHSLVSWAGDEDKQNPKNFTAFQKVSISIVTSLMNLTVSMAVSVFSAMLDAVAKEFGQRHSERMQSTLIAYLLGLALGTNQLLQHE